MNESVLASRLVKTRDTVRDSKGFLFEAEDTPQPVLCRDVRGFPQALAASKNRGKSPGRLVIVVPDLAMEDWLARWAEDDVRVRRNLRITRRVDGQRVRIVGTLLAYGCGIDTAIAIEQLEADEPSDVSDPGPIEPPPRSVVRTATKAKKTASKRTSTRG